MLGCGIGWVEVDGGGEKHPDVRPNLDACSTISDDVRPNLDACSTISDDEGASLLYDSSSRFLRLILRHS